MSNGLFCMQTRQKQRCATYTPAKRDARPKNDIGMNIGNKFPLPLIYMPERHWVVHILAVLKVNRLSTVLSKSHFYSREKHFKS